jgi:hypothetical protein
MKKGEPTAQCGSLKSEEQNHRPIATRATLNRSCTPFEALNLKNDYLIFEMLLI